MKRMIVITAFLMAATTACARLVKAPRSPQETAASPTALQPAPSEATATPPALPAALPANPTPDFAAMSFVEKNNLYLQLLAERQAEGVDTAGAEDAYMHSVEATLEGDSALADRYLEQAILSLWK